MQQIAMRTMHFDAVDAQPRRAPRRPGERFLHAQEARGIERERWRLFRLVRNRGWRERHPAAIGDGDQRTAFPRLAARCLAARMRELHRHGDLRILADRREYRTQRGFGHVVPEAEITGRDASVGLDGGRLDEQHARARPRELAEMDHVPRGGFAALRRVLTHRRDENAIRELQAA